MSKTLIVYFSHKGENYCSGNIRKLEKGNTEIVAEMLADLTGGELYEVERKTPYPEEYRGCVEEAKKELQGNIHPELKEYPESLKSYDVIYVGYPNWCGTLPMPMVAFLEHYDLTGKQIFPFCTNEGSGLGRSIQDLKTICKGAVVEEGLSVRGTEASKARPQVEAWVNKNK